MSGQGERRTCETVIIEKVTNSRYARVGWCDKQSGHAGDHRPNRNIRILREDHPELREIVEMVTRQ